MQTDYHTEISLRLHEKRQADEAVSKCADACQIALAEWLEIRMKGSLIDIISRKLREVGVA